MVDLEIILLYSVLIGYRDYLSLRGVIKKKKSKIIKIITKTIIKTRNKIQN